MSDVPSVGTLDSTAELLSEGYEFISNRCRRYHTDIFETRLLFAPAVCMQGAEAAQVFYEHRLTRRGALPVVILGLLQDKGSVLGLDGEQHRARKELFLSIMEPGQRQRLMEITAEEWRLAIQRWQRADHVVLMDAVEEILCRAVCAWAGVPLGEPEAYERTREFAAMLDGTGSVGSRNVRGHLMRRRTERWAVDVINQIRAGSLRPAADSAAAAIARHEDAGGQRMTAAEAAVELINILRPTVAVARFVAFEALALHQYGPPAAGAEEPFVQEVRRFYPFFPAVAGKVTEEFEWRGYRFRPGLRVLLDLYGTDHDPRVWKDPESFQPERFADWDGDPWSFIPQGGGDHAGGHRCPGEWETIELMKLALRVLTQDISYTVPPQDLRVPRGRLPGQPVSRFVIRDVRAA
jgi:fatty-acid peroxygenase